MRKRILILLLLFSLPILCAPARAEQERAAVLETDPEVFSMILAAANWDVPSGHQVDGFLRTDLNGDAVTDAIVLLKSGANQSRLIAIVMSGESGYQVIEDEQAIPFGEIDAGVFAGLNAGADYFALYTKGVGRECFENEYFFSRDGSQFSLSKVTSVQWLPESLDATQSTFDFSSGEYIQKNGTMQNESFQAASETKYAMPEDVRRNSFAYDAPASVWNGTLPASGGEASATAASETNSTADAQRSDPEENIYCNACGQYYATGDAFRNHICAPEPQEAESFFCAACEKQFESDEALQSHVCLSYANDIATCDICGQSFASAESYQTHICISYLDDNSVYCDICGGWYAEGEAFRSHLCIP